MGKKNDHLKKICFVAKTDAAKTQIAKELCNEYFSKFFVATTAGIEKSGVVSVLVSRVLKDEDNIKAKIKTQVTKKIPKDNNIIVTFDKDLDLSDLPKTGLDPIVWTLDEQPSDTYEYYKYLRDNIKANLDRLKVDFQDGYISC